MNKREMIQRAMAGHETPQVPYHVVFLGPLQETIRRQFNQQDLNRAVGNFLAWELPPADVGRVDLPGGEWLDEWGVRWRDTQVNRGYITEHPLKEPDVRALKKPALDAVPRMAGMAEACEQYSDLFLLAWCGEIFERAHFLRGMENLLVDFHENPQFVHALLDICLESTLEKVPLLAAYPVDAIILSDDYGQQHGPIMSPRHFREFIKPRLKTLFDAIRATGKKVGLHSCGDVSLFIPDFIELGLDILHPVQPDAMDVHEVKRQYGGSLCLYGGISVQQLIRFATPEEIRDTVRREKEALSRNGRFILAPTLDLTHDMPLENVLAFIEAAQAG